MVDGIGRLFGISVEEMREAMRSGLGLVRSFEILVVHDHYIDALS